jgi:ribosomal protein S18 acetylase RimI-like enzyme
MLEFINSLVEEGADISMDTPLTRESEIDWLAGHLSSIEKERKIAVAAEVGGRFVGQVEVNPKGGRSMHVGVLGIAIREGFRDAGIGTEMMKEAEAQSGRLGIEIMTLEVFDTNEPGTSTGSWGTKRSAASPRPYPRTESIWTRSSWPRKSHSDQTSP